MSSALGRSLGSRRSPPAGRPVGWVRRGRIVAALGAIGLVLALPSMALAHPLGNFTVNHYAGVRIEPDRVILDVVIDQAEIPTFQEKLRIDTDGDGSVSDAETEAERIAACPVLAASLMLTADGRRLDPRPFAAGLTFPPGAAGLETMRLVCTYAAARPEPVGSTTEIAFSDSSHEGHVGWREIVVTGSGVTVAAARPPTTTTSDRLTSYPRDRLDRPLDIRSAAVSVTPGGPVLPALEVPDAWPLAGPPALDPTTTHVDQPTTAASAAPGAAATSAPVAMGAAAVPGGVGSDISGLLESRDLTPLVLLGSIAAALALGAGHALTPGHGKTLMGAYLVGTRGTPLHAIALGLSVTVSHTLGIVILAAIVIAFRGVLPPETFDRYAPIASGLLVIGIGSWLLVVQLRARRDRASIDPEHGHDHDHDHGAGHEQTHTHGGTTHSHLPATTSSVTWRSLFVLGLAGGIIPSTNALIILLATIATGRAVYGLVLVVAFGLGMAAVLGGVGLGLVFARDRVDRLPSRSSLGRAASYAPVMAGVLVFGLGIYLTTQAIGVAPTL